MDRAANDEAIQNALELALQVMIIASSALERAGDEVTRSAIRSAIITAKDALQS